MNLNELPSEEQLLAQNQGKPFETLNVNGHFHTPFSFSAFKDMNQVFEMARKENVKVLGINDFYVTDGYDEFFELAVKNKVFPLFNIEAIALSKEQQAQGIRVNDPNNPGRTYFSGKGLDYPVKLSGNPKNLLDRVKAESQRQVVDMIEKLNQWLKELGIGISFTYESIRKNYARQLVRERHIAKALRIAIFELENDDEARKNILQKIYSGKPVSVDIQQAAALENELRNNLLKAGGKAFVEEDELAFLSVEQIKEIVISAGGIPCYPVLLDDKNGNFTDFEENKEQMLNDLIKQNIYSIELIPGRNKLEILEAFVSFFDSKGFVITLGTEHNAPDMIPLTIDCRGGAPLSEYLRKANYEGACIVAAHQYLRSKGKEGYVDQQGKIQGRKKDFISLGNAVIHAWID